MNPGALDLFVGFSNGFQFSLHKNKEDEVKQGKNYYLASLSQGAQLLFLGEVIQEIAKTALQSLVPRSAQILCNVGPLLYIPFGILAASVKQGGYASIAARAGGFLPRNLGERTVRILGFFSEHTGDLARVGMVVSSLGLIYFGSYAYGGAVLAQLVYREIDMLGFVPYKWGLFIETYMAGISDIVLLFGGNSLLIRVLSAASLLTNVPSVSRYLQHNLDAGIHRLFSMSMPSLAEYEAPLVEREDLTSAEINQILYWGHSDCEINPAHCSKWVMEGLPFPEDRNFRDLEGLFNEISWVQEYFVLRLKLKDDQRFFDFLKEQFPKGPDIRENFDRLIGYLAQEEGKTADAYAAKWVQEQMSLLVQGLLGEIRIYGTQKDIDASISNCAKILAYLKSCPDNMEKKDILLKLAIEAGGYSARGVRRASDEILQETVIPKGLPEAQLQAQGPRQSYELKLRQALQNERLRCVQAQYSRIKQEWFVPDAIGDDVHGFDMDRTKLSLGFYPMTQLERNGLAMIDILEWIMGSSYRKAMHDDYEHCLDAVITEQGEVNVVSYIRERIETSQLSDDEKESIIEKYTSANSGEWTVAGTNRRFHRLVLVMLGVLRLRSA